jgi:hypothetical protein
VAQWLSQQRPVGQSAQYQGYSIPSLRLNPPERALALGLSIARDINQSTNSAAVRPLPARRAPHRPRVSGRFLLRGEDQRLEALRWIIFDNRGPYVLGSEPTIADVFRVARPHERLIGLDASLRLDAGTSASAMKRLSAMAQK